MCTDAKNSKKVCYKCNTKRASFVCKTCGKRICLYCVLVTVLHGKWNFFCDLSCVPLIQNMYAAEHNLNAGLLIGLMFGTGIANIDKPVYATIKKGI